MYMYRRVVITPIINGVITKELYGLLRHTYTWCRANGYPRTVNAVEYYSDVSLIDCNMNRSAIANNDTYISV